MWMPPPLSAPSRLRELLPEAGQHIDIVASELERGLFTPQPADAARARTAGFSLLLVALRAAFINRLSAPGRRNAYSR